jgi:hydroxymethylbilane synthase
MNAGMKTPIRIATRASKLALWQAEFVARQLEALGYPTSLVPLTTQGDIIQDRALHEIGGKGLFIKELEVALAEDRADIAVHSSKDLPARIVRPFTLAAFLPRHSVRDAIIFNSKFQIKDVLSPSLLNKEDLRALGPVTIATSSLRRSCLLKHFNDKINIVPVRGNVDTRIRKMEENQWDAIILAEAAIERLNLSASIRYRALDPEFFIPSPAQGALAVETRGDHPVTAVVARLGCQATTYAVTNERHLLDLLGGDCSLPIGCHCALDPGTQTLSAQAIVFDGNQKPFSVTASIQESEPSLALAQELYTRLLDLGYRPRNK